MTFRFYSRPATLLAAALLTACAGKSPPVDFFILESGSAAAAALDGSAACKNNRIAVGPVSWPRYLDQPRIVTREEGNRLAFNEFNRWAGSLQDDFSRLVVSELSVLLDSERVTAFSRTARLKPDYRVEIDIQSFEGRLGGDVSVVAKWGIIEHAGGELLAAGTTRLNEAVTAATFTSQVRALGTLTGILSHEIATELVNHACSD